MAEAPRRRPGGGAARGPAGPDRPSPPSGLQNGSDGLVLYDPQGNVLDAVAWGDDAAPLDPGDLPVDDPGTVVRTGNPAAPNYLHLLTGFRGEDNCPQAPNDVLADPGTGWQRMAATPGAPNANQASGSIILSPPPGAVPDGLLLLVR